MDFDDIEFELDDGHQELKEQKQLRREQDQLTTINQQQPNAIAVQKK